MEKILFKLLSILLSRIDSKNLNYDSLIWSCLSLFIILTLVLSSLYGLTVFKDINILLELGEYAYPLSLILIFVILGFSFKAGRNTAYRRAIDDLPNEERDLIEKHIKDNNLNFIHKKDDLKMFLIKSLDNKNVLTMFNIDSRVSVSFDRSFIKFYLDLNNGLKSKRWIVRWMWK